MTASVQAIVEKIVPLSLMIGFLGCDRGTHSSFDIVAPGFNTSRVSFAHYGYSPVGAFGARRGDLMPFIDVDGDGSFDPQHEVAGQCDQQAHRCWFNRTRLRLAATTDDCSAATGIWMIGNIYDTEGRDLDATLCDDSGPCSRSYDQAFQDANSVNAIWIAGASSTSALRSFSLRSDQQEVHYENILLPASIEIVSRRIEHNGDLRVFVTANQTIDLAAMWIKRGQQMYWTSGVTAFRAEGATLMASIPEAVFSSCAGLCETYIQIGHVWRDDEVFSIAEIKQQVE